VLVKAPFSRELLSRTKKIRVSDFSHQWVEDILYFEGPILSLLKANTAQDYFYFFCGERRQSTDWLAFEVSRDDIEKYKTKAVTLLDIIQSKEHVFFLTTNNRQAIDYVLKIKSTDVPEQFLPPDESYFDAELCPSEKGKLLESPRDYSIRLDGRWFLEDLIEIPRVYNQLYSFIYTLRHLYKKSVESNATEIFSRYPWRGGFSAVNFYQQLKRTMPSLHEARVQEISYASPGTIRLELLVDTSIGVRDCVNSAAKNASMLEELQKQVRTVFRDEGLAKIDGSVSRPRLNKTTRLFLERKADEIAGALGLSEYALDIRRMAGNDLLAVKILLSFYRRILKFSIFQNRGMIDFD
jgi:hypothetical protein